ncbi:MAG: Fur family transcriptional regulator [Magnetovibrio sp.]|nr:Fur family transcriptional regulator [Magnetovibrio sp.]
MAGDASLSSSEFPDPGHDHDACRDQAIDRAERLCAGQGARLTPQRREVLELLLAAHQALGAYEIMEGIDWGGRKPAPVVVYRALDFLMELGLVHRLASVNAYVACGHAGEAHGARFLICTDCRTVAEVTSPGIADALVGEAERRGFAVGQLTIEISGVCPHCRGAADG